MRDQDEQRDLPEDPDERVRKADPAGVRTGWGRPFLIIAIVGAVLLLVRLAVLLFTM